MTDDIQRWGLEALAAQIGGTALRCDPTDSEPLITHCVSLKQKREHAIEQSAPSSALTVDPQECRSEIGSRAYMSAGGLGMCLGSRYLELLMSDPITLSVLITFERWAEVILAGVQRGDVTLRGLILISDERAPQEVISQVLRLIPIPADAQLMAHQTGVHPSAIIAPSAVIHPSARIGPSVVIEPDARVGSGASVGAFCYIGPHCDVGRDVTLYPRVTLLGGSVVEADAVINAGAVIGSLGFGLDDRGQLPHHGVSHIGSGARIGALTCVDRATIGRTEIGPFAQLDNLIQVGHNTRVGAQAVICAQSGLSGGVQVGERATLAGQVGVAPHVQIGQASRVGAKSGVTKDLKASGVYSGYPAEDHRPRLRRAARLRALLRDTEGGLNHQDQRGSSAMVRSSAMIDPSATIDPSAIIEPGAIVGALSVIGPRCHVESYAIIGPQVVLDADNHLASFAVVGASAQVRAELRPHPEIEGRLWLHIGVGNTFREGVTISRPTLASPESEVQRAQIGDHNLFMAHSHLGHDAHVGSHNTFANGVSLAGHVSVGDHVHFGGHAAAHQFVTIGDYAFIAANAMVSGDVPPFCLASGDRATLRGLNIIGLRRAGFSAQLRLTLKRTYRLIHKGSWSSVDELIQAVAPQDERHRKEISAMYRGVTQGRRPCCRPKKVSRS